MKPGSNKLTKKVSGHFFGLGSVVLLVLAGYSNTYSVPFLFDDDASLAGVEHLYQGSLNDLFRHFGSARAVGYASFKLNYELDGFNVLGFHVANTLIHILAGVTVYLLAFSLFKALDPANDKGRRSDPNSLRFDTAQWFAVTAALLFVLHPIQTQAVTYIVQRLASLVALWYLLALCCYVGARTVSTWLIKVFFLLAVLVFGFLAIYTKQNSFTLPFAILLVEIVFFRRWRLPLWAVPLATVAIIWVVWAILEFLPQFPHLDRVLSETQDFSRLQYFETQLGILPMYLKLYLLPVGQQVEIIYPLKDGSFAGSWYWVVLHISLLAAALYSVGRYPWFAFGLLFFYLAHSVESGFVPISDLAFEHRMYLPSFGLALMATSLIVKLRVTYARACSLVLIALLLVLTYQRNGLWAEPIKLMQSEIDANFDKPRIHAFLGDLYRDEGEYSKAAQSYENAFNLVGLGGELDNQGYEQRYAYLNNYVANLGRSGQYRKAIDVSSSFLDEIRNSEHLWALTNNLGYLHYELKDYNQCIMHMMNAVGIDPKRHESFVGAGLCFYYLGREDESLMMFTNGLALAPNPEEVRGIMVTLSLLDP